jgi:hypothetical protein
MLSEFSVTLNIKPVLISMVFKMQRQKKKKSGRKFPLMTTMVVFAF